MTITKNGDISWRSKTEVELLGDVNMSGETIAASHRDVTT